MQVKLEDARPDAQRSFRLLTPKLHDRFYWHYHPEYELIFIAGADGTRHIGEHIARYEGSDLAFIGPYIPHLNFDYGLRTDYEKVVVQLRADFLGEPFLVAPELASVRQLFERAKLGLVFHGDTKRQVGAMLQTMTKLPPFHQLLTLLDIFQLLAESPEVQPLGVSAIENSHNFQAEQRMKQVQHHVSKYFTRKIEVQELASLTHLSPAGFCRFFKKLNGVTFTEHLNRHRIRHAQQLLLQGANVTDACFQSGFENLSYFNKVFKKMAGENPLHFKRKMMAGGGGGN